MREKGGGVSIGCIGPYSAGCCTNLPFVLRLAEKLTNFSYVGDAAMFCLASPSWLNMIPHWKRAVST